ncbi:NUDIX domain-containing protein [Candidatus Kuenenbacteria bacterium]|nr:NUDIX domain-containing protein [Candidatus Kuenenbacteria bacterium]
MDKKFPKVGMGVMIMRDNKVLLGLRQGSHGAGEWSFPGGHLDFGESLFTGIKREAMEETGLEIDDLEVVSVSDDFRYIKSDGKHHLTVGVRANSVEGESRIMEPNKCQEWRWFGLEELPEDLFEATETMINNYKNNRLYKENIDNYENH